ncbi:MAG: SRPBCC family protein [Pseudorhodoplanes sp.]
MSKPTFVYVTYIASTPEKVFKALTDTDATAKFWFGNAVTSDWKVGSPVTFHRAGKLIVSGKVLEHDAPRRLSYTFQSLHEPHNGTEKPSRVVMDLEQQRDQVKLTVTHDEFVPDSKVFVSISNGWPLVLSNLKSYLETGTASLYAPWYEEKAKQEAERAAS